MNETIVRGNYRRLSTLRQGFQLINQYYNDIDHMKYIGSVFKVIGENIFQKDSTEGIFTLREYNFFFVRYDIIASVANIKDFVFFFFRISNLVPEELMLKVDVGQLEICQKCKVNRVDKK